MQSKLSAVTALALFMAAMITHSPASAGELEGLSTEGFKKTMQGGLLYDKWYSILGAKTEGTHPAYPAEGKKSGESTWRCKECHGWDYKGRDGAYSVGSHYSGIKGIRGYTGKEPAEVMRVLKDKTHSPAGIPDRSLTELAYFVSYGQIDMDTYIDPETKKASGDPVNGAKIYTATCTKCHGADGKKINFKTPEKPEYMGTLANKNPWETMHKLRFGHPGSLMPGLLFLDVKEQADVLLHTQTLPEK